jgi:twitching motility protein PilT
MLASAFVRNLIRESKNYQITNIIQTSGQQGMQSLNKALAELAGNGAIDRREAFAASNDEEELKELLGGHMSS